MAAKKSRYKDKEAKRFKQTGGTAYAFEKDGRKYYITDSGLRFHQNDHGTLTNTTRAPVPLYNRISFNTDRQTHFRQAKLGKGSHGTSYKETRSYTYKRAPPKVQEGSIGSTSTSKRVYRNNMERVTGFASATAYAQDCLKEHCPTVAFNWCHLLGHGIGGSDKSDNLMAGTTYCNSEQLQIESMVYQLTNAKFLRLKITGQPYGRHAHLARTITYKVTNPQNGRKFTHKIDALRTSEPTGTELEHVRRRLLESLFDRETLPPEG